MDLSNSRIDQLGSRLRAATVAHEDLELLDAYRLEFAKACTHVTRILQEHFPRKVTARPAKSTRSVVEKLQRESIRFSQMQDVAGCRVIVDGILSQDDAVQLMTKLLEVRSVIDRRRQPSAGYRAVHIVVVNQGRLVEVQVRTLLQHRWAELSEKLSDTLDPTIKYGGGPVLVGDRLESSSKLVAQFETFDRPLEQLPDEHGLKRDVAKVRLELVAHLDALEKLLLKQRGKRDGEDRP